MSSNTSSKTQLPQATFEATLCYCAHIACLKTAYTEENYGRRFYGCINFEVHRPCDFFCWHDPEIPTYGKRLIKRLQGRIKMLEERNATLQEKNTSLEEMNTVLEVEATRKQEFTNRHIKEALEIASTRHRVDVRIERKIIRDI